MNDSTPLVPCSKCGTPYPQTSEYFYVRDNGRLRKDCKNCTRNRARNWRETNPEQYRRNGERWRQNNPDRVKEIKRRWRVNHSEQVAEIGRRYRLENPGKEASRHKKYREANKPKIALYNKGYRKRNKDKRLAYNNWWNENNRDRLHETERIYRQRKPEIRRSIKLRRRANERNAEGVHTPEDITQLYFEQEGRCGYCGIPVFWDIKGDVHIDHMIPLIQDGSNYPSNLCISCSDCNLSKQGKTPMQWAMVRGW